jgi:hypothetical protein
MVRLTGTGSNQPTILRGERPTAFNVAAVFGKHEIERLLDYGGLTAFVPPHAPWSRKNALIRESCLQRA